MIEQKTSELLQEVEGRIALLRERRAFMEKADARFARAKKGAPEKVQAEASREKRMKDLADSRAEAQQLVKSLEIILGQIKAAITTVKKEKP